MEIERISSIEEEKECLKKMIINHLVNTVHLSGIQYITGKSKSEIRKDVEKQLERVINAYKSGYNKKIGVQHEIVIAGYNNTSGTVDSEKAVTLRALLGTVFTYKWELENFKLWEKISDGEVVREFGFRDDFGVWLVTLLRRGFEEESVRISFYPHLYILAQLS